jgi:hypothetical protein
MKVRAITSFVSPLASAVPGEVFDVPGPVAEEWLRAGLVERESPEVEVAVRAAAEQAVTRKGRR